MFLLCLWKAVPGYEEQYNDQFGSARCCVSTRENNAIAWGFLHLVTGICHKRFIMKVRSVFFRRPWRNLKERLFFLLKRGMTKKYLEMVMCWTLRSGRWLPIFHGPQRTTLPYLHLWPIQVDNRIWIQSNYVDCNCIEQDLPTQSRK